VSTRAKWVNGILTYYEGNSHEQVLPMAPIVFYDDFLGAGAVTIPAAAAAESGMPWAKKIVGAAPPTVAGVADAANGVVQCALTADSQKQDAGLYHDDQRGFSLEQGLIFEARVKVSVLPTLVAEAVWGLVGDWADGLDAITYSAFFTADGGGALACEVDDNTTDQSAAAGVTVLNTEWKTYRIDFTDLTDIRFYIDGVHVATGTTFKYVATGANAILQPYFGLYKASGAGVGTIQVDYCRCWMERS
jgi:hypothetical protein